MNVAQGNNILTQQGIEIQNIDFKYKLNHSTRMSHNCMPHNSYHALFNKKCMCCQKLNSNKQAMSSNMFNAKYIPTNGNHHCSQHDEPITDTKTIIVLNTKSCRPIFIHNNQCVIFVQPDIRTIICIK